MSVDPGFDIDDNGRGGEIPTEAEERPEFIDKIKVLNVQKGDVIVVKYEDLLSFVAKYPHMENKIPYEEYKKMMDTQLSQIKRFIEENWGKQVGMICLPVSIDLEVIRLEEWFV